MHHFIISMYQAIGYRTVFIRYKAIILWTEIYFYLNGKKEIDFVFAGTLFIVKLLFT